MTIVITFSYPLLAHPCVQTIEELFFPSFRFSWIRRKKERNRQEEEEKKKRIPFEYDNNNCLKNRKRRGKKRANTF